MGSTNIQGIGLSEWTEYLDIFMSFNKFNPDDWIYIYDTSSIVGVFFKNPLKVKGTAIYNFEGASGYYYATDPNTPGYPNGYRYIWYMYAGMPPGLFSQEINYNSAYPGYGTNRMYYPVNIDDLVAAFNKAGYSITARDIATRTSFNTSNNTKINSSMLFTGNYGNQKAICNRDFDWQTKTLRSSNYGDTWAFRWQDIKDDIKLKFGITDEMMGYTVEAIEACLQCPTIPVSNVNPLCCFQDIYQPPDDKGSSNNRMYRPIRIDHGSDGHRKFYYRNNTILTPDSPNISYFPFNVFIYVGDSVISASTERIDPFSNIAIVFQGVEPLT